MTRLATFRGVVIVGSTLFVLGVVLILVIDQPIYVGAQAASIGLGWAISAGFVVKYTTFGLGIVMLGTSPIVWLLDERRQIPSTQADTISG